MNITCGRDVIVFMCFENQTKESRRNSFEKQRDFLIFVSMTAKCVKVQLFVVYAILRKWDHDVC